MATASAPTAEYITVQDAIDLSFHADPKQRAEAVRALCPCVVQADLPRAWNRLIAMAGDESVIVRRNVFHVLADGSPRHREAEIIAVLEGMRHDPDLRLRRRVRGLLAHYRAGGRLNVL